MGNEVCLEENAARAGVSVGTDEKGRHVAVHDTDRLTISTALRPSGAQVSAGASWEAATTEGPGLGSGLPETWAGPA